MLRRIWETLNWWLYDGLFGFTRDGLEEYVARFVEPLRERAEALGIPNEEIVSMWKMAVKESSIDYPPGIIMRRKLDHWEAEHHPASPQ